MRHHDHTTTVPTERPRDILALAKLCEIELAPGQEACLRLLYSLPIVDPEQIRLALKATGRESLPAACRFLNAVMLAGRRSGKSTRFVALIVLWESLFAGHAVPDTEDAYLPVIAPTEEQARKTFKTIMRLLDKFFPERIQGTPRFSQGEASIDLTTRITITVQAARSNAVRGGACVAVIFEESCHFGREDRSAHPLSEIVASLRPSLLTCEATGAKMVFVSSPWVKSGLVWDAFAKRHEEKNAAHTLVMQLPSRDLNPSLSEVAMQAQKFLQGESWYQREYLSEFVDSGESLIPPEAIDRAVVKGHESFLPQENCAYVAGFDLSARGDDSALGIAHAFEGTVQLDLCSLWKRPAGQNTIDPFLVLEQACTAMQEYNVSQAFSDQVLQSVVEHTVKKYGIFYQRTITYGTGAAAMWRVVRELFVTGKVRIPENKTLISQLKALEMKFVDGGGSAVEAKRGHDDLAVACALAIYKSFEAQQTTAPWFETLNVGRGSAAVIPGQGVDAGWKVISGGPDDESAFGRTDFGNFGRM
ncbi:MAG TPA: hypothetical protein VMI32_07035 [Candidatus Solibacter sp.]|nr:hypothetical protein [Candidatus Solibacter sp.]